MSRTPRIAGAILAVVTLVGCTSTGPSQAALSSPAASSVPSQAAPATQSPTHQPAATDSVVYPLSALPDPPGDALPGDLVGRTYNVNPPEKLDGRESHLTLRAADDAHCVALYNGRSTCFTILWSPVKIVSEGGQSKSDPGARGAARMVDHKLVLQFDVVPFSGECVGTKGTYAYEDAGQTLRGITPACGYPAFREIGAESAASSAWVFDTRRISKKFALAMTVTVPGGWKPLHQIVGALGFVHTGFPELPDSQWWGPDVLLVEEAQIHDPADVTKTEPVKVDRSQFVPWPDDFFGYITALPGVTVVSGPEPITIGGVAGTQIRAKLPAIRPLVWMKGDYTALGSPVPAAEYRFIVMKTGGHTVLVSFFDTDPEKFEARDAEVLSILQSISFD